MAIRDTNGHAGVALAGGPEELWPVSGSEAAEPPDWRSLYERERERAEAAEARAEELRWAEVRARSDAGSWKWRWEASRRRLRKVVAETREARRAARDALALQREVERLHGLLREAGVDAGKRSTVMALRMEVARLRKKGRALEKALDASGSQSAGIRAVEHANTVTIRRCESTTTCRPGASPLSPLARIVTVRSGRGEVFCRAGRGRAGLSG